MQKDSDMNTKLKDLGCPFNWEMEDVIANQKKLSEKKNDDRLGMVGDMQDNFPEFVLMYHVMLTFENVINNDIPSALQSMNKVEQVFDDINTKATLKNVKNVLQHIVLATKCHIFQELGKPTEADELLKGICEVREMSRTQLATLSACKCLAWSLYYLADNGMAINHAKRAIALEPSNGKWHFLLGKNYRRARRRKHRISEFPDEKEISAFEKAYRLSKNVFFGVSLARVYRENKDDASAIKIYKQVYALQPTSCIVQLQLALGFIRNREPLLAKRCLEYVAKEMPDSVVYQHYMGLYELKCNRNNQAALPYFESTTQKNNFGGEWDYIRCKVQVERGWNPLQYMLELKSKYAKDFDRIQQEIQIQIGWHYFAKMNDIASACRYFIKAIEIQPDSQHLKDLRPVLDPYCRVNVYRVLSEKVQNALQNYSTANYNQDVIAVFEETLQLCHIHSEW